MTSMLHKFPDQGDFGARIQLAELDYLVNSKAAADFACGELCRAAILGMIRRSSSNRLANPVLNFVGGDFRRIVRVQWRLIRTRAAMTPYRYPRRF